MSNPHRIAVSAYPLDFLPDEEAYRRKLTKWVEEASAEGAKLLVFPEYGSMELATLAGPKIAGEIEGSSLAVSQRQDLQADLHTQLARKHDVFIIAASLPCSADGGQFTNMARIFTPSGKIGEYHKLMPTPFERETWGIKAGPADGLTVFDLGFANLGLVICYDIEFPLISRALAEAGAEIIVAPSNTELEHGYWRVRTGCAARALENQIFTVQSPTVGDAPWSPMVDKNTGAAGVFAPPDHGFPANGVIALGDMNQPGWVYADLDFDQLAQLRDGGGVQTYKHWPEQPGAGSLPKVKTVSLT